MQKNTLIIVGVAVILMGAGLGVYMWQKPASVSMEPVATSTPVSNYPVNASTSAPVVITPLPVPAGSSQLPPHPVIERAIEIPASFSVEAKTIMLNNIASIRATLKANPQDLNAWIDLGNSYKAINDYPAALEAWEYVSLMSPTNIVSFSNVGNLYHYELKSYAKAEQNLLQVIKNDPRYVLGYANLHDLYRLSYKQDTTKASDILEQGIKQNPKAIDLIVALAAYYKGKGNLADARTYYQRAISLATEAGNTALAISLKAELKTIE